MMNFRSAVTFLCLSSLLTAQSMTFTEAPKSLQFFSRDSLDTARVSVSGTVSEAGHDSLTVTVLKNGTAWSRAAAPLSYGIGGAAFSFTLPIHAELAEYRFEARLDDSLVASADSVVCGDAYLAEGQSNTVAIASHSYSSEWIRSYGTSSTDGGAVASDSTWGLGQASSYNSHCAVGVWELQVARHIVETYQVPVFFLNGAVGGTDIGSHVRDNSNKANLNTIYGRFYYRIMKTGLASSVKALFWYQGESHAEPSCYNYKTAFANQRGWWKEDFPGLELFYMVQIHHGCGGPRQDFVREVQRTLPAAFPDIRAISTNGLPGHDGCHYNVAGYLEFGDNVFRMVARDFYGSADTVDINPPDVKQVVFMNDERTRLAVLFDQNVTWPANQGSNAMKDYFLPGNASGAVDSGKAFGNSVVLYLKAPSSETTLTYLPNITYLTGGTYEGPYIRNSRSIGALSFMDFPITYGDPNDSLAVLSMTAVCRPETLEQYASGTVKAVVSYAGGGVDTTSRGALFTCLDTFVAAVNPFGDLTAKNLGTARIRVEKRGLADTALLHVVPTTATLDSIRLPFPTLTLVAGDSFQTTATAYYRTGTTRFTAMVDTFAEWSSDLPATASVVTGKVKALLPGGPAPVIVSYKGLSDTLLVTVLTTPSFLRRINFQVSATPFKEGWSADNGGAYSAGKGWGWVNASGLATRDDRGGTNFLLKSFVVTATAASYKIDAPDGEYALRIGMGDNAWGVSAYYWTALGNDTLCRKLSGLGNVITTDTVIAAGGNGITLTVLGAINYLVMVSTAEGTDINYVADDGTLIMPDEDTTPATEGISLNVSPNPTNPAAIISFRVENSPVSMALFSMDGRKIRAWDFSAAFGQRRVIWDGRDNDGRPAASGVYLLKLTAGQAHLRQRIILAR